MKLNSFLQKNNDFMSIDSTLQNVVDNMVLNKVKHIVLLKDNKPEAIITERDILFLYTRQIDFNERAIDFATKELIVAREHRKVAYALELMINNNIRRIIVVNKNKEYLGSISQEEIIFKFEQDVYKSNIKVSELIKSTNRAMYVYESQSLQEAIDLMSNYNIGSVLVYNLSNNPIGILTESDVIALAQKNVDTSENIKMYMHFPIITFDRNELLNNIVTSMKNKKIRRVLIKSSENDYYVVTSRDILNNLKGNYSLYLEAKLRDVKTTFNLLDEIVLELFDFENEQIIHWFNKKAKKIFDVNIDDEITKVIPENIWDKIYIKIKNHTYKDDMIFTVNDRTYKIIAMHSVILNNSVIKILFDDVTQIINEQKQQAFSYKNVLDNLPSSIAIVDENLNIVYKNLLFESSNIYLEKLFTKNDVDLKNTEIKTLELDSFTISCKKIENDLYLINILN